MKRTTRKVEKRTFTLQNALPRFVSIVTRGANFTPLSELRFADGAEKFSDVEINRIVFSKENFTRETVEQYLNENDYAEYSIEEDESAYVVPGVAADQFEEVTPIEYGDGVQFFVGKIAQGEVEQPANEVVDSQILDFQEPTVEDETTTEATADAEPEVVQEGDLSVDDLQPKSEDDNEEDEDEGDENDGKEGSDDEQEEGAEPVELVAASEPEVENTVSEVFNDKLFREKAEAALAAFMEALELAKTESFSLPAITEEVEVFTAEQVTEAVNSAIEAYKLAENTQTEENSVDETTILVQNSQVVQSEEIPNTVSRNTEENAKFSERKTKDLFGL